MHDDAKSIIFILRYIFFNFLCRYNKLFITFLGKLWLYFTLGPKARINILYEATLSMFNLLNTKRIFIKIFIERHFSTSDPIIPNLFKFNTLSFQLQVRT